jgi:hypothetical protein
MKLLLLVLATLVVCASNLAAQSAELLKNVSGSTQYSILHTANPSRNTQYSVRSTQYFISWGTPFVPAIEEDQDIFHLASGLAIAQHPCGIFDLTASYELGLFQVYGTIQNLLNDESDEPEFDLENRLQDAPVSELHFTPGTPRAAKLGIAVIF